MISLRVQAQSAAMDHIQTPSTTVLDWYVSNSPIYLAGPNFTPPASAVIYASKNSLNGCSAALNVTYFENGRSENAQTLTTLVAIDFSYPDSLHQTQAFDPLAFDPQWAYSYVNDGMWLGLENRGYGSFLGDFWFTVLLERSREFTQHVVCSGFATPFTVSWPSTEQYNTFSGAGATVARVNGSESTLVDGHDLVLPAASTGPQLSHARNIYAHDSTVATITQFEILSAPDAEPVIVPVVQGAGVLPQSVRVATTPGEYILVRGRLSNGRRSRSLPVRVHPHAEIANLSELDGTHWDASPSFGRTGTITEWKWTFGNLFGDNITTQFGETLEFDAEGNYTGPADNVFVRLQVNDSHGLIHDTALNYPVSGRCGMLYDFGGALYTAARSGGSVKVYRFKSGVPSRETILTLTGRNPTIWAHNSRQFIALDDDGGRRVRFSEDWFKTVNNQPVMSWPKEQYRGANECGTHGGGAASCALKIGTDEVWYRFSPNGLDWSKAPVFVGNLGASPKALQIRQKRETGSITLEITNGLDKKWRSKDMGTTTPWPTA